MKDDFVNLHVHSHCSIGDSVIRIPDLIQQVKDYGQKAVALTDHGSTMGWREFNNECCKTQIKPIFGNEFYCKIDENQPNDRTRYHMVMLAKNNNGLKNINYLQRITVEQHQYYKPLLPYSILNQNNIDGIFVTTACSLGSIGQNVINGDYQKADEYVKWLINTFGLDNIAFEFQFHPNYEDQKKVNEYLYQLYDTLRPPYIIVTCDSHFLSEKDRELRKYIQAINWHKPISQIEESLSSNCIGTSDLVLKFAEDSGFDDTNLVKKMIKNTSKIANLCEAKMDLQPPRVIPKFNKHNHFKKIFLNKVV